MAYDWTTGEQFVWQAERPEPRTLQEQAAWRAKLDRERKAAEEARSKEAADTAARAARIWNEATERPCDFGYLKAKGVADHGLRIYRGSLALNGMRCDGSLLIPARDKDGNVASLQFISADGEKRYLNGPRPKGCYYSIGKPNGQVVVAEGYATAASIFEATGHAVAIAFDAGNLEATAKTMRAKFPQATIVIAADNDVSESGNNRGIEAATGAARAVGGRLAVPELDGTKCDFNDLMRARGTNAVRDCIANVHPIASSRQEPVPAVQTAPIPGAELPRILALEIGELLQRDFPPKEPLLAPWLRRQDLAMVYARRGVGKTHFALGLAYAVASGGKFLEWEAPKPRRVLYIDGEMPGATMKDRLAAIAESQDAEPPEGFLRIVTPDVQEFALPDLATKDGQQALAPVIGNAELIVLDNLSSLMRAGVENEGEAWVPMATWALARRREGRAVLFIHHGGKNGQQRGSSRREDLLDVSVQLKHPADYMPEQGARFEITFEKARGLFGKDVEAVEAALSTDANGNAVWTCKSADGTRIDKILELYHLGMGAAEIAQEVGIHRSNVYRALKERGVDPNAKRQR